MSKLFKTLKQNLIHPEQAIKKIQLGTFEWSNTRTFTIIATLIGTSISLPSCFSNVNGSYSFNIFELLFLIISISWAVFSFMYVLSYIFSKISKLANKEIDRHISKQIMSLTFYPLLVSGLIKTTLKWSHPNLQIISAILGFIFILMSLKVLYLASIKLNNLTSAKSFVVAISTYIIQLIIVTLPIALLIWLS